MNTRQRFKILSELEKMEDPVLVQCTMLVKGGQEVKLCTIFKLGQIQDVVEEMGCQPIEAAVHLLAFSLATGCPIVDD